MKENQKRKLGIHELNGKIFHVAEGLRFNGERKLLIFSDESKPDYLKMMIGCAGQGKEAEEWFQGFVSIRTENEIYINPKISIGEKNENK